MKNHSGDNSALVLRPADAIETSVAWKLALENTKTPSALILSRQNITDVPAASGDRFAEALNSSKGAYTVKEVEGTPDIILVANGSEVATMIDGAAMLEEKKGLKVRVVSAPSEGLFNNQDEAYKQSVISYDVPVLGLTAGLPVNLRGLVGPKGKVIGLDHFGYSAPYTVLDEKLGYTAENVFNQSVSYIESYS